MDVAVSLGGNIQYTRRRLNASVRVLVRPGCCSSHPALESKWGGGKRTYARMLEQRARIMHGMLHCSLLLLFSSPPSPLFATPLIYGVGDGTGNPVLPLPFFTRSPRDHVRPLAGMWHLTR
jgi:hypothetical protein